MLRHGSTSRRLWVATAAAVVSVIASGCAAADSTLQPASSTTASATTSSVAPDPDAAKIISIATDAAKANGDTSPTAIQWVRATRGAIAQLIDFGVPASQRDANQILILVTGSFTDSHAHIPPGAASTTAPSGRNLEIVVDPNTWETTDFGIGDFSIDLSTVGLPHTG